MLRFTPLVLWITIATSSVGCSGLARVDVGTVLTSGRDGWQHPDAVIEALEIAPGDRIAEIGAGSGYWLPHLSAAVGDAGRVYAVEVEAARIAQLERFVARKELSNVEIIFGELADPRLPDGAVDLAMTSLTYHHLDNHVHYFAALRRDLSAGGRVVHLDDRPNAPAPISWFQAKGHQTPPAQIRQEMESAGYRRIAAFDFLPAQSFQVFEPAD